MKKSKLVFFTIITMSIITGALAFKATGKRGSLLYSTLVVGDPACNTVNNAMTVASGGAFRTVTTAYCLPGVLQRTILAE